MYGIAFVVVAWRGAFFFAFHTACTFTRGKAYVAGDATQQCLAFNQRNPASFAALLHPLAMWRLCAAVLVLQLPISEGKSDEPKYDYSYDEPEYDEDGMIVRGPFGNAEYDIDLGPGATAAMYLD